MDVTPLIPQGKQIIEAYGEGGFRISGQRVEGSVIVFPDKVVAWAPAAAGDMSAGDLQPVSAAGQAGSVELLLIGTGARMTQIDRGLAADAAGRRRGHRGDGYRRRLPDLQRPDGGRPARGGGADRRRLTRAACPAGSYPPDSPATPIRDGSAMEGTSHPPSAPDGGRFAGLLAGFDAFGSATRRSDIDGVPVFENEFWTAKQRQAHPLHEVSYRACFKPQLPRFFIEAFTEPGAGVYDPFAGRGTTLIEAALLGRRPDRQRRQSAEPAADRAAAAAAVDRGCGRASEGAGARLAAERRRAGRSARLLSSGNACGTSRGCGATSSNSRGDAVDAWIRMVCLNRLTGHSSGFFSVYTLPPNQATSAVRQRKINEARRQVPPKRDVFEIVLRKTKALLKAPLPAELWRRGGQDPDGAGGAYAGDRRRQRRSDRDVAAVPGCGRLSDRQLAALLVRRDRAGDGADHAAPVAGGLGALRRSLLHASSPAWCGRAAGSRSKWAKCAAATLALEHTVLSAAAGLPLQPLAVMINRQVFTKTAQCWGVDNNAKGTNSNRIVVFERR